MRAMLVFLLAAAAAASMTAGAAAQHRPLLDACAEAAHKYFGDFEARTDMRWSEPRVDGTRTVNGEIHLETRAARISCAFRPRGQGRKLIEFHVDGRDRLARLREASRTGGGGSKGDAGRMVEVRGVPARDVLNVRSGPGVSHRIVGALANGDRVRELTCRDAGGSTWCRIRMLDDMRSEGWVNARYLRR